MGTEQVQNHRLLVESLKDETNIGGVGLPVALVSMAYLFRF